MEFNRPGVIRKYEAETLLWEDYDRTRRCTVSPQAASLLLKSLRTSRSRGSSRGRHSYPTNIPTGTAEELAALLKSFRELAEEFVADFKAGKPFWTHHFHKAAEGLFERQASTAGCGAGRSMLGITYDGYVVPCHRFSREPKDGPMCLGTVKELLHGAARGFGAEWTARMAVHRRAKELPQCVDCVARESCFKGCYHCNWSKNHDLFQPTAVNCAVNREAVRLTLWIDRQLRGIDAYWWKRKLPGMERANRDSPPRRRRRPPPPTAADRRPPRHREHGQFRARRCRRDSLDGYELLQPFRTLIEKEYPLCARPTTRLKMPSSRPTCRSAGTAAQTTPPKSPGSTPRRSDVSYRDATQPAWSHGEAFIFTANGTSGLPNNRIPSVPVSGQSSRRATNP